MMIKKREWEHWWQTSTSKMFPRDAKWVEGKKIETPTTESPVRRILAEEAKKSGDSVLDIGCATCIDYEYYREQGLRYTGVDITEKYLDYARELYPEIDVRLANVVKLPFKDGEYDTVSMKSLVEHLHPKEWRHAVAEAWRVAKNKLMICFVLLPVDGQPVYKYHPKGFWNNHLSKQELVKHLKGLKGYKHHEVREGVGRHTLYIMEKQG